MKTLRVQIELPESIRPEIQWAWDLFCTHCGIDHRIVEAEEDLLISQREEAQVRVSEGFERILNSGELRHQNVFPEEPFLRNPDGKVDVLGTAFYMVNSLQEWDPEPGKRDDHGRFLYIASYQYRFGVVERDLVSELFDELREKLKPFLGKSSPPTTSKVFLTHDIDRITRGNIREAAAKIKAGKLFGALPPLAKRFLGIHEWNNIEEILQLHKQRGFQSCFFWLPEQGKAPDGIANADYDIEAPSYQRSMEWVKTRGSSNGLHKSSFSSGFEEEFQKLGATDRINRNHYLKFQLPAHYQALEEAGFLLDSSLGFREAIGFRNSYGRPFHPFDPEKRKPMNMLEVPLHIMDVTLYQGYEDPLGASKRFLETHAQGKILTILWHNNHLTKGRFETSKKDYEALLDRIKQMGVQSILPEDMLRGMKRPFEE